MVNAKRHLIVVLLVSLLVSFALFAVSMSAASAQGVIGPHEDQGLTLDIDFAEGKLQVSTTAVEGYEYQYWIKSRVTTDNSPNLSTRQYIWKMVKEFDSENTASITVTSDDIDENGKYNVIVRIKDDSGLVDEIYGAYAAAGISMITIDGRAVQDEVIIEKGSAVTIGIVSEAEVSKYALYYGESTTALLTSEESGEFSLTMNYKGGYHIFRAEIETVGGEKDTRQFKVYLYDAYAANQRPVITSLTGVTEGGISGDGKTTFTMTVEYANGNPIPLADANKFKYTLVSENIKGTPSIVDNGDGTFRVEFSVDYNGKHGIYQTVATISRSDISGADDKIIRYYYGYARPAALTQTATAYSVSAGESITITATGSIEGANGNLEYAFYREDASGWVLMSDYSPEGTVTWTPTRPGTYNIQARIRESGAGSYEKVANAVYTVSSVTLEGDFSIKIIDCETGNEVEGAALIAGKPYRLEAVYTGSESLLYMFTLYNSNLPGVYLNHYTVSPYFMFIPTKADDYLITARAIDRNSYGYKDTAAMVYIHSSLDHLSVKIDDTFTLISNRADEIQESGAK